MARDQDEELLDDIERVLFKAKEAKQPFIEFLLRLAFLETLANLTQNQHGEAGDQH